MIALTNHVTNHENNSLTTENVITIEQGKETVTEQKFEGAVTEPQSSGIQLEHQNEAKATATELHSEEVRPTRKNEPNDNFTETEMHQIEEMHETFLHFNEKGTLQRVSDLCLAVLYSNHREIVFLPQEECFYRYISQTGKWEKFAIELLERDLTDFTNRFFNSMGLTVANQKLGHQMMIKVIAVLKTRVSDEKFFEETPEVEALHWFHYANCMVEFNMETKSWEEKPFSPKYRSRESLPIRYDPTVVPRRFITELIEPAMNEDDRAVLQQYAGQCLLGTNESQKVLVMTGTPNGGKGTLVEIIRKMVGTKYCAELRLDHSDTRFETSHYVGKSLLVAGDVGSDFLMRKTSERLKAYVGGDPLNYEFKCAKGFGEITGNFNVIITSNHTLQVRLEEDFGAWERRLIWIRYQNPPPAVIIRHFDELLIKEEGSGIANWMMEGAAKIILNGGHIDLLPAQKERIQLLLDESSPCKLFARDYIIEDENATITMRELWNDYNAVREGRDFPGLRRKDFTRLIKDEIDLQFHRVPRNDISRAKGKQQGYKGLRFNPSGLIK
jgi:hypothetical protein